MTTSLEDWSDRDITIQRNNTKTKAKIPEETVAAQSSATVVRRKGTVILSDNSSSDEAPVKLTNRRRKPRASFKSDSSVAMDSELEREARELMDLDDGKLLQFLAAFVS